MYIALEIMNGILHGAASIVIHAGEAPMFATPPVLHLIGAATGAGVAYVGLKLNWLDAGGWDLFSGRHQDRDDRVVGDYVMPASNAALPKPKANVPSCEHCGRVRPASKRRCTYCGLA